LDLLGVPFSSLFCFGQAQQAIFWATRGEEEIPETTLFEVLGGHLAGYKHVSVADAPIKNYSFVFTKKRVVTYDYFEAIKFSLSKKSNISFCVFALHGLLLQICETKLNNAFKR
ncbi:hypothetical protein ACJX0J_037635, partial [Zea mays]